MMGIEEVLDWVVIGRGCNYYEFCILVSGYAIESSGTVMSEDTDLRGGYYKLVLGGIMV